MVVAIHFSFSKLTAQSLVSNGDFETYINCPTAPSQIAYAAPWKNLYNHIGTSDYFNVCATDTQVRVPKNIYGMQAAASGAGYAGITLIINTLTPEYREYIATQLTTPLVAGEKYLFTFKCSLADECRFATNNIGVYFSSTPPAGNNVWDPPGYVPQLKVQSAISNKTGWDSIAMIYTATGGEKYFVVGNFYNSANTNQTPAANGGWFDGAYVYIDDVSLTKIQGGVSISHDTSICAGDSLVLHATGNATYAWTTTQYPANIFSHDSTITVSPAATTTYLMYGDQDTASIKVTVRPRPMVFLGNDTVLCEGETMQLNVTGAGDSFLWPDGSVMPVFTIDTAGTYWVSVLDNGCRADDTIKVFYAPYPHTDLGMDKWLCVGKELTLTAGPANASYIWSNGSTSRSITISHPGVYWVSVSINGCSDIDTINVFAQTENCECIALLPTAFSPNGDQKNDVLRIIHSKNVVLKKFYVFNRWGETVFIANDFSEVWDGSYKGEQVGQGTYYYFFEYFCPLDQQNYRVKGDVTIVR